MDLSFDQFVQTVSSLKTFDRDGIEKRRAMRVGHRARVFILVVDPNDKKNTNGRTGKLIHVPVQLRDFSMKGLRFVHKRPMQKGESFILLLRKADGQPVHLLCTVAHCQPASAGATELYNIGARIERPVERELAQPGPTPRQSINQPRVA